MEKLKFDSMKNCPEVGFCFVLFEGCTTGGVCVPCIYYYLL